jgi:hypothetical protein
MAGQRGRWLVWTAGVVGIPTLAGVPVVYALGWLSTFTWLESEHPCGTRGEHRLVQFERNRMPLRRVCVWDDGVSLDLVPAYVNPLFFLLFGIGTACLLLILACPTPADA